MNRETVIQTAIKEIGTFEDPSGSNKTKYGKWYNLDRVAWCAIFVSYVFDKAKLPLGRIQTAKGYHHCQGAHNFFKGKNRLTKNPQKGDIVMFDWQADGWADHTGIFVKWTNAEKTDFTSIEGNTSTSNNSNGGMVMERNRRIEEVKSFVNPEVYDNIPIVNPEEIITIGDRGSEVAQVQKMLDDIGYDTIADGWFGKNSAKSVKEFQKDNLMEVTGKVDEVTLGALQEEANRRKIAKSKLTSGTYLSYKNSGYWVTVLQRALNKHGANPKIIVDGQFGRNTKKQVMLFQERKKLTVDGVVGPQTFKALGII